MASTYNGSARLGHIRLETTPSASSQCCYRIGLSPEVRAVTVSEKRKILRSCRLHSEQNTGTLLSTEAAGSVPLQHFPGLGPDLENKGLLKKQQHLKPCEPLNPKTRNPKPYKPPNPNPKTSYPRVNREGTGRARQPTRRFTLKQRILVPHLFRLP